MLITICIWHAVVNTLSSVFGEPTTIEIDRIVLGVGLVGYIFGHIIFAATVGIRVSHFSRRCC